MTGTPQIGRRRLLAAGGIAAGAAAGTLVAQAPAEAATDGRTAGAAVTAAPGFTDGPGGIVVPYRAFDSRTTPIANGGGTFTPGTVRTITVNTSIQGGPSADHVFLTVTVTKTTGSGYLTVFPADRFYLPTTSTINWTGPGQTLSTGVLTPCQVVTVSKYLHRSKVKIHFTGVGHVEVIVDVASTWGIPHD